MTMDENSLLLGLSLNLLEYFIFEQIIKKIREYKSIFHLIVKSFKFIQYITIAKRRDVHIIYLNYSDESTQ